MNFYRVVRDFPEELISEASKPVYEEEEYYRLRNAFNSPGNTKIEDAALLLYLNKTGYNGLYRVNSRGEFNVPFGRYKHPRIVQRKKILKASEILENIEIHSDDFTNVIGRVRAGDLCYLDPPYHPSSRTADFREYHHEGFSLQDQIRLRKLCLDLDGRGVSFVLSNSDTPKIRSLYESIDEFRVIPLKTRRLISSKTSSRTSGRDVLVTNCI
jgi:DNA adenine methylase